MPISMLPEFGSFKWKSLAQSFTHLCGVLTWQNMLTRAIWIPLYGVSLCLRVIASQTEFFLISSFLKINLSIDLHMMNSNLSRKPGYHLLSRRSNFIINQWGKISNFNCNIIALWQLLIVGIQVHTVCSKKKKNSGFQSQELVANFQT